MNSSFGNWWLDREFWARMYSGEGRYRPGEILYELKADYFVHYMNETANPHSDLQYQPLYRTNFFAYNLLGDPEVSIYTDMARKLKVQHPQKILPVYRNHSMTIKVLDDMTDLPVYDADVCIYGKDTYMVARTDENGIATFNVQIQNISELNITVTSILTSIVLSMRCPLKT
jgi:hypothetical protein